MRGVLWLNIKLVWNQRTIIQNVSWYQQHNTSFDKLDLGPIRNRGPLTTSSKYLYQSGFSSIVWLGILDDLFQISYFQKGPSAWLVGWLTGWTNHRWVSVAGPEVLAHTQGRGHTHNTKNTCAQNMHNTQCVHTNIGRHTGHTHTLKVIHRGISTYTGHSHCTGA